MKQIAADRSDVKPPTSDSSTSWAPAVLATLLGLPLVAISALKLVVMVVVLSSPDVFAPSEPGVTYLVPADRVIALAIAELVFLVLAGVGLIGLSWLFAMRQRANASWGCAVAVGSLACIVAIGVVP